MKKIKAITKYLHNLVRIYWLPIVLFFVFILQINFFNFWLNIAVRPYLIRRSIASAALGLLLFGPSVLLKKHTKYLYLFLTSSFLALIFILYFLYYAYSGGFLQVSAIFYSSEGLSVMDTVKTLLTYRLFLFIICPLIVALSWILVRPQSSVEKSLTKKEKILTGLFIITFTLIGYGYLIAREYMEAGNINNIYQYSKTYDVEKLEEKLGIINFFLGDTLTSNLRSYKASAADMDFVKTFNQQHQAVATSSDFGLLKDRNLIIIQVESLENSVIGQKINNQEITPNLNQLADQGLYFPHYYSPIGPGSTADAEFMTLTSLYSLPDQVAFIQCPFNNYTALPGLLKNNGYHTYSLHGDVSSFWNRANIYPQLGYEKWFDHYDYTIPRKIGAYDLGDKDFFTQSIPKLKSLPQPFMATLITLTSHTPFELPPDLETLNIPSSANLNWLQYHYLQGVHYTDQAIGDFIDQLKSAGLYNNSLILIYGDHSSFTNISSALKVNNSVFPELQATEVPMIMLAPGSSLKGKKNLPTSHLDLYPTVANLLGFAPPQNVFGHDMVTGKNALAISRNQVSGTIKTVLTDKLAYQAADDGVFEHGICLEEPTGKALPVNTCKKTFDEETNAVKASDLMVKANLINTH